MKNYVIYTFSSSSQAMASEILMERSNIKSRLVPLLPEIDAGCGLALRLDIKFSKTVEEIFEENKFQYENRYIVEYNNKSRKPVIKPYDLSR
ncbi:MAG: DUF3343 domain-containing protein [Neofamilia sp.]